MASPGSGRGRTVRSCDVESRPDGGSGGRPSGAVRQVVAATAQDDLVDCSGVGDHDVVRRVHCRDVRMHALCHEHLSGG